MAFVLSTGLKPALRRGALGSSSCEARPSRGMRATVTASHTLEGREIQNVPTPLRNFVLAKRAKPMETTVGGVVLSGSAQEKPNFGTVVKTGTGGYYRLTGKQMPIVVEEGDTVIFGKYGGVEVDFDNAKHMFVDQFDLLCKLKDGDYKPQNVEALFDRVFIKVAKPQEKTASGIMIAAGAEQKKNIGEVVSVGLGKPLENGEYEPLPVKVGDQVLWGDYVGTRVEFGRGNDYIFVRASDIFAAW